jgi:hypothetical protein
MCGSPGTRPATSALLLGCAWAMATACVISACRREPQPGKEAETGFVSMGIYPAPDQSFFFEYPVDGVDLGQGWHREAVSKAVATCIDFTAQKDTGQEQSMELSVVHDRSAVMDALDVSAEAQFKSIGYSVSGKARYAKETEVRSNSVNVVAHAKVMNGVDYVAPSEAGRPRRVDLTHYYRDLARRNRLAFEQECGDGFVAVVYSGAELAGVLSVDEFDTKTRASLEASLSGSIGGFSAAGKVESSTGKEVGTRKVRVTFYQTGGSGGPMPTTELDLVAAVRRLPALAAESPYNYRIQVQSYRSLPGYPADTEEDPDRFRRTLATSYGRLLTLWHAVVEALELEAGIDYADSHEDQGASAIRERMQALHDELMKKIERIRAFSRLCAFYDEDMKPTKGPNPCAVADDLTSIDEYAYRLRLPVLKSKVGTINDPKQVAAAVIDQHVRDVSRRRCERNLEDPGCLLESEIEELSRKLAR